MTLADDGRGFTWWFVEGSDGCYSINGFLVFFWTDEHVRLRWCCNSFKCVLRWSGGDEEGVWQRELWGICGGEMWGMIVIMLFYEFAGKKFQFLKEQYGKWCEVWWVNKEKVVRVKVTSRGESRIKSILLFFLFERGGHSLFLFLDPNKK